MASLLNDLARKSVVRAVVITGGDEIFCAGADISEMAGHPMLNLLITMRGIFRSFSIGWNHCLNR
jgi:enoyl-CoA hydratase/carnithine racemase